METPAPIAAAVVAVVLLLLALLTVALRGRARSLRALATALAAARAETGELRQRLDALSDQLERQSETMIRVDDPAFVITDAGSRELAVPDRMVLTATVGDPLVKAVALGHGVRRALSAESRNRIWFEVRREVRRARKQRRREMKDAWRRMQAADRTTPDPDEGSARPADAA